MPKLPRLTAGQAEKMLFKAGFEHARTKGSHRIYIKGIERFVLPFHGGKILHPKITKNLVAVIEERA